MLPNNGRCSAPGFPIDSIDRRPRIIDYGASKGPVMLGDMNESALDKPSSIWPGRLIKTGYVALLFGAIDPMAGSLAILPGSGLIALGTSLSNERRSVLMQRLGTFFLIALGVGSLWGLSRADGFGTGSGRSMWWGLLVLPYLLGWSLQIWGTPAPRWTLLLGTGISLWYMILMTIILGGQNGFHTSATGIVIGATGFLTFAGCCFRLVKPEPSAGDPNCNSATEG